MAGIGLTPYFRLCYDLRSPMPEKTILVCEAQVPFVHGGAEYHVRELVSQLRAHGHATLFGWRAK